MYLLKKIWNLEIFQGKYKKQNYFEGWYFKVINARQDKILGVIPGIAYGNTAENSHAFVQVIDVNNTDYQSHYFLYPLSQFSFSTNKFEIRIDKNFFSRNQMIINLENERTKIKGELNFYDIVPFPSTPINPGIMGPFSFIPFMECYHGIVNIHHNVLGSLSIGDKEFLYDNGYGYIEKDWGKSFPDSYIWLQSNHFQDKNISIMFSLAKIPWFGKYFIGHISFLRIGDKFYRFATYTGALIKSLSVSTECIEIVLEDKRYHLEINAVISKSGLLRAPQRGIMKREILESITSKLRVLLKDFNGNTIFQGEGMNAGLEIVGDPSMLFPH